MPPHPIRRTVGIILAEVSITSRRLLVLRLCQLQLIVFEVCGREVTGTGKGHRSGITSKGRYCKRVSDEWVSLMNGRILTKGIMAREDTDDRGSYKGGPTIGLVIREDTDDRGSDKEGY